MLVQVADGVSYAVHVKGGGEPVLLVHGFTGSSKTWTGVVENLSKQYTTITIDMLGHGQSDSPSDASRYAMPLVIADILYILNMLKLESIRLVGYSMGGRIALAFAITYSERVQALVLESASPGLQTTAEQLARTVSDNKLADNIEQNGLAWFAQYWGEIPLFASQKRLSAAKQQQLVQARLNNNPKGLANSLRGIGTGRQASYWEQLTKLKMPVTLIVGQEDSKYVTLAHKMKYDIPHAKVIEVAEAGHNIHLEQQEAFITHLKKVL